MLQALMRDGEVVPVDNEALNRSPLLQRCADQALGSDEQRAQIDIPASSDVFKAWQGDVSADGVGIPELIERVKCADFLEADLGAAADSLNARLARGHADAPAVWAALKHEHAGLRAALVARHPAVASATLSLAEQLRALPRSVGLYAVRSRFQQAPPRATLRWPDFGASAKPSLTLDMSERVLTKDIPALLPALAELEGIALVAQENPAQGWDTLVLSVLSHLTHLHAIQLHPYDIAQQDGNPLNAKVVIAMRSLRQLRELSMDLTRMPGAQLTRALAPALAQLTQLSAMHLSCVALIERLCRSMAQLPAEPARLPAHVRVVHAFSPALERLSLELAYIDAEEMERLAACIRKMPLRELRLPMLAVSGTDSQRSAAARAQLCGAIASRTALSVLDADSWLQDAPPDAMGSMFRALASLERANLGCNVHWRDGLFHGTSMRPDVWAAASLCHQLQFLDLSGWGAFDSDESARSLGKQLTQLRSIRVFELAQTGRSDVARPRYWLFLRHAAAGWPRLVQLCTAGTEPKGANIPDLLATLRALPELEHLALQDPVLSAEDADQLAGELADALPSLTCLDLTWSSRSGACPAWPAHRLVPGLARLPALKCLMTNGGDDDLHRSNAACTSLMQALPAVTNLQHLLVQTQELSAVAHAMPQLARALPRLQHVGFGPERRGHQDTTGLDAVCDAWRNVCGREVEVAETQHTASGHSIILTYTGDFVATSGLTFNSKVLL